MTEAELWTAYHADRSVENRNALIVYYMPYVRNLAKSLLSRPYVRQLTNIDELASVGTDGMYGLIQRYDPKRGKFTNYAYQSITKNMIRSLGAIQRGQALGESESLSNRLELIIDPHDYFAEVDASDYAESAGQGLTELQQDVIEAHYIEGLPLKEIAEQTGRDLPNTCHRLKRAVHLIKVKEGLAT